MNENYNDYLKTHISNVQTAAMWILDHMPELSSGNLYDIFDWYDKHKGMKLAPETRTMVEKILAKIKKELDKEKEES